MSWIEGARHAVEHHGFVMVEPDGSWHQPTETDWQGIESTENDEILGVETPEPTGIVLDTFTASMLVQIHDNLNPENQGRFAAMPITRAVDVGWKLVKA